MKTIQPKSNFWTRAHAAPSPRRDAAALIFIAALLLLMFTIRYFYEDSKGAPKEITEYIELSTLVTEDAAAQAAKQEPQLNPYASLSVPTYVNYQDGLYFLVDCYHDQILYHENMDDPLTDWLVLTNDVHQAHTIASDGVVYLVDDTENNRVLVFEKVDGKFVQTQLFENIGSRPHYIRYDERTGTFYVWSSMTGELYCFRHTRSSSRMYLTEIRKLDMLDGVYVRSFTIQGNSIYFVSGQSQILQADLKTLELKKTYPVPDAIAGMVQLLPVPGGYLVTVSTDREGDQSFATILWCNTLGDLAEGNYTDVYENFVGGGTPYYITRLDDTYYLTEHRVPGHSVWSFRIVDRAITDVKALY